MHGMRHSRIARPRAPNLPPATWTEPTIRVSYLAHGENRSRPGRSSCLSRCVGRSPGATSSTSRTSSSPRRGHRPRGGTGPRRKVRSRLGYVYALSASDQATKVERSPKRLQRAGKVAVAQTKLRVVDPREQVLRVPPVVLARGLLHGRDVAECVVCATEPVVEHGQRLTLDPGTQLRHRRARIVEHQRVQPGQRIADFRSKAGNPGLFHGPVHDFVEPLRRTVAAAHLPV